MSTSRRQVVAVGLAIFLPLRSRTDRLAAITCLFYANAIKFDGVWLFMRGNFGVFGRVGFWTNLSDRNEFA
jgi:hypothetical protein